MISPKRQSTADFVDAWQRLCNELRPQPEAASITDANMQREISHYRAGK